MRGFSCLSIPDFPALHQPSVKGTLTCRSGADHLIQTNLPSLLAAQPLLAWTRTAMCGQGKARFWATSPVLACWGACSVCAVPGHASFGQCSTEVSLAQTPDLGTPGCRGKVKREAQPGPLAWIRLQIKTYPTHVMG